MEKQELFDKLAKEIKHFRSELTEESDRGCALYACGYLEQKLSDLLFVMLVANSKIETELFDGHGALSSFSNRISMSYYLGLISRGCKKDLDLIRKIRNDFAHSSDSLSFESEGIKNRCSNLDYSYHKKEYRPRGHFTAAIFRILGLIEIAMFSCKSIKEKEEDIPTEEDKEKLRNEVDSMMKTID